jgi:hypothetical protein
MTPTKLSAHSSSKLNRRTRVALARNRTFADDTQADGNAQIAAIRGMHGQTDNRPSPIWALDRIGFLDPNCS